MLGSRPVSVVLWAVILVLSVKVIGVYLEIRDIKDIVSETENEIVSLQARTSDFKDKVAMIKEGKGVEKEVRTRFNMKKSGENTVVIVEDAESGKELEQRKETAGLFAWLKSLLGF